MRWIVHKELAIFFADRAGAFLTLVVPTLLAALVGMLFAPPADTGITLLVADADQTAQSKRFIAQIEAGGVKVEAIPAGTAKARIQSGAAFALEIPAGTGAALHPASLFAQDRPPPLRLLRDPARQLEGQMLQGVLVQASMVTLLAASQGADLPPQWSRMVDRFASGGVLPVEEALVGRDGSPANYHSYAHAFAGMLCMFLLFAAQGAARRLVEERAEGSLVRLRLADIHPSAILWGVGVATAIVALIASVIAYAVGLLLFDIPIASPIGFGVMIVAQAACVGGFALLLAGIGRTARQIDGIGTFAILVMSFAGGAWLPSFLMPDWLRAIALGIPTRWTTDGLAAVTWRNAPIGEALLAAGILIGFGLLFGAIGARRFRWE